MSERAEQPQEYRGLDDSRVQLPQFQRVQLLTEVDSTNSYAQRALATADETQLCGWGELSVIATGNQVAGKGRLNRVWSAPAGTALATSFIIRPQANPAVNIPMAQYHWFTLLVALAAVQTWRELGVRAEIKWPNDVMVQGKKVCGVLAQLINLPSGEFAVVVGIGMNINLTAEQLPVPTATSALIESGRHHALEECLNLLGAQVHRYYRAFAAVSGNVHADLHLQGIPGSLLDLVRAKTATIGMNVNVHLPGDQIATGTAEDINDKGELVVHHEDGSRRAYAVGDIVHMRPR
ncbi:biotin--[acetyl-CoA-carboxylase] ligase [Rothia sp. LK2588]|uniref:biotin--[acetyl-CoA-carboxylase] ligase n=1 Tax=Rothia sp. LK2588 TaxID=3114369 RepID=UPI0034CE8BBD